MCVMLAEQHHFLDLTVGLRIEGLDTIKVIPCSLDELFAITPNACWACKKEDRRVAADGVSRKKCAACHAAQYCCKECQVKDWKGMVQGIA